MKTLLRKGYEKPEISTLECCDCICADSSGVGTTPFDDGGTIDQDWN